jgi:hypothetical protein
MMPIPESGRPSGGTSQLVFAFGASILVFAVSLWISDNLGTGLALGAVTFFVIQFFVMIALRYVQGVIERLVDIAIDATLIWLQALIPSFTGSYKRKYAKHIHDIHRHLRFFGIREAATPLKVEKVFVELTIGHLRRSASRTSSSLGTAKEQLDQTQTIWEFLDAHMDRDEPPKMVLTGSPGSGKSELLKHIALRITDKRPHKRPKILRKHIPILLMLREQREQITSGDYTIIDAVERTLKDTHGPAIPRDWFARQLQRGRCVVLIDGLDEVSDDKRAAAIEWINRSITRYGENIFIITSRPYGYDGEHLLMADHFRIAEFDQDQKRQFIINWYREYELSQQRGEANLALIDKQAIANADTLLKRIHNSRANGLATLSVNPLLLAMMTAIHRYGFYLPEKRIELYEEISRVFLSLSLESSGNSFQLSPKEVKGVLQPLAFAMMLQGTTEIGIDAALQLIEKPLAHATGRTNTKENNNNRRFLKHVQNRSGLFFEVADGRYCFAHKTFQEYFAADCVARYNRGYELINHIDNPRWHETILLYAALTTAENASEVVQMCLNNGSAETLALAIRCNEEANIVPEVRKKLFHKVKIGLESDVIEIRQFTAQALLKRRLRSSLVQDNSHLVDRGFISNAEYGLFLVDTGAEQSDYAPRHWSNGRPPRGTAGNPVAGISAEAAEAFCRWLTEHQREPNIERYRLPSQHEFPAIHGEVMYWAKGSGSDYQLEGLYTGPELSHTVLNALRDDFSNFNTLRTTVNLHRTLYQILYMALESLYAVLQPQTRMGDRVEISAANLHYIHIIRDASMVLRQDQSQLRQRVDPAYELVERVKRLKQADSSDLADTLNSIVTGLRNQSPVAEITLSEVLMDLLAFDGSQSGREMIEEISDHLVRQFIGQAGWQLESEQLKLSALIMKCQGWIAALESMVTHITQLRDRLDEADVPLLQELYAQARDQVAFEHELSNPPTRLSQYNQAIKQDGSRRDRSGADAAITTILIDRLDAFTRLPHSPQAMRLGAASALILHRQLYPAGDRSKLADNRYLWHLYGYATLQHAKECGDIQGWEGIRIVGDPQWMHMEEEMQPAMD